MKTNAFLIATLIILAYSTHASANTHHAYTNTVSAHNINTIQRSIITTSFNSFRQTATPNTTKQTKDTSTNIYGQMPTYGEYNDDGSMGRSGGDTAHKTMLANIWLTGTRVDDTLKFDEHDPFESQLDIISAGITGNQSNIGHTFHNWGLYTGYITGDQENKSINIDEQGGFFGIYNGFFTQKFNLATTINGGAIDNANDFALGTDGYTNFWMGGAIQMSYDIALDKIFIIRPALYTGYTWIKSNDYTSVSNDKISNDTFHFFEISPEIKAIKNIGNGWTGAINAKYIITLTDGGNTYINNTKLTKLDTGNFFEYGLSVEKQFKKTTMSANIGRRDGFRYGWFGGLDIKYAF